MANSGGSLAGVRTGLIASTCDSTLVSDCSRELWCDKDGLSNQVGGFGGGILFSLVELGWS